MHADIHTNNPHYSPSSPQPQPHNLDSVAPNHSTPADDTPPPTQDSKSDRSGSAPVAAPEADILASGSHRSAIHTDLAGCVGRRDTASRSHTEDAGRGYRAVRRTQRRFRGEEEEAGPIAACTVSVGVGVGVYIVGMDRPC